MFCVSFVISFLMTRHKYLYTCEKLKNRFGHEKAAANLYIQLMNLLLMSTWVYFA